MPPSLPSSKDGPSGSSRHRHSRTCWAQPERRGSLGCTHLAALLPPRGLAAALRRRRLRRPIRRRFAGLVVTKRKVQGVLALLNLHRLLHGSIDGWKVRVDLHLPNRNAFDLVVPI